METMKIIKYIYFKDLKINICKYYYIKYTVTPPAVYGVELLAGRGQKTSHNEAVELIPRKTKTPPPCLFLCGYDSITINTGALTPCPLYPLLLCPVYLPYSGNTFPYIMHYAI
jgi:hypothetical protein